jgi:carbon-monoxide dehydrogenase large subunit
MVADWLGVPEDKIRLLQADTDEVAIGRGTYASRSMMIGGSASRAAADEVIARGKRFAAHFMEADAADIAFADGQFTIAGTDRSMPIGQLAQMSFIPVGLPSELGVGLQGAGVRLACYRLISAGVGNRQSRNCHIRIVPSWVIGTVGGCEIAIEGVADA